MSEVFDYQHCIDAFMDSLAQLHGHIVEHDMHEGSEQDAEEIVVGLGKLAIALERALTDEDWATNEERQEREWNEAWDYLRDNLRKWWC